MNFTQNQDFGDVIMQLFETMRIDNGHIPRLTYHTNRIKCSSERLNFKFDEHAWRNELNDVTTKYHSGQYRLKIVLHAESEFETIVSPLPEKVVLQQISSVAQSS